MTNRFCRRSLLKAAGLSGALLPMLHDERSFAAGEAPKRLVILCWTGGIHKKDFWPVTRSETDWDLSQILAPLAPYKSKSLVLAGLDIRALFEVDAAKKESYVTPRAASAGNGHWAYTPLLTGAPYNKLAQDRPEPSTAGNESIDQYVARHLAKQHNFAFPSLVIGGRTNTGPLSCISYKGADDTGITPENDPTRLFKTLFEGRNLPKGTFDKLAAERQSVLDLVGPELARFGKKLGTEDRLRVEAHHQAVRELERSMVAPVVECTTPTQPMRDFGPNEAYPDLLTAQFRLLAAALRCDLTRVATFMLEDSGGNRIIPTWLGKEFEGPAFEGNNWNHHEIAHAEWRGGEYAAKHTKVNVWLYEQVAAFLKLLDDVPEGDGTMLDNTAVVITNGMGQNHWAWGVPAVIVGSCGRHFKTGRVVKFGDFKDRPTNATNAYWYTKNDVNEGVTKGVPYNGLLVALANAMGVETATFGDPKFGGELPGLRA